MKEYLHPDAWTSSLSPQEWTVVHGRELLDDPGLAQLRRALPVLAVVAAPFVGLGDEDPLNSLDPVGEWGALIRAVTAANARQAGQSARLALVRLAPPTAAWLGSALSDSGPDAFRVAHIVAHGERDLLYLEDEDGHEAYAVAEQVVSLFRPSGARVVILEGCFSRRLAQMLVDGTPVQAVVGTRRRVAPANALTFNSLFYAALAQGQPVRDAYRTALAELKTLPNGQADRYDFVFDESARDILLPLPEPAQRAARPLVADGMPRSAGVPVPEGFIGRRELLGKVAAALPGAGRALLVLHGPGGIGKTWLAAEFAARFGWRFVDGVLWIAGTPQTTAPEVLGRLARLLDLPPTSPEGEILAGLRARRVLLVLDDVDALPPDQRARLADLAPRVAAAGECAVLIVAREPGGFLAESVSAQRIEVGPLRPKDARALALWLAVEGGLDALDVDTIDDFLERTLALPWLIVEGARLIEARGINAALDDLRAYLDAREGDLQGLHVRRQLRELALREDRALTLLARVQALPDAFDEAVARGLAGAHADSSLATLLGGGLLRRAGALLRVPRAVQAQAGAQMPVAPAQQAPIDRVLLQFLARTWPAAEPDRPPALTPDLAARLNNARALIQRQLKPGAPGDAEAVAGLLLAAAPAYRGVGLVDEFSAACEACRARLSEGPLLARLQVALGELLSALPARRDQAGWLFQVTLTLDLDPATRADASRAYARHLITVGEPREGLALLASAIKALLAQPNRSDVKLAARLAYEWARALAEQGRWRDAVPRYEAALAGYTEAREAACAAVAQRDLGAALHQVGELARAAEVLQRALAAAERLDRPDLACAARCELARVYDAAADETLRARAAALLAQAAADALAAGEPGRVADVLLQLARVQARGRCYEDAAANLTRSRVRFERAGEGARQAETLITLGQLRMAQGDSVTALDALRRALETAQEAGSAEMVQQAASVMLRVHELRARHALATGDRFRADMAREAQQARTQLAALGLGEHAAALDAVIAGLAAR